jgi:hypothetical protein
VIAHSEGTRVPFGLQKSRMNEQVSTAKGLGRVMMLETRPRPLAVLTCLILSYKVA